MNENTKDIIKILEVYAAGINGAFIGYHASVDVSGDVPQLVVS